MARYFPSNSRMAVGVTDYLDAPDYDQLAFEISKQDALSNAKMNEQGAEQVKAGQDAERYIAMAEDGAASSDANSQTQFLGQLGRGVIDGVSGGLGFMDFGGNSGLAPDPAGSMGNPFGDSGFGLGMPGGSAFGGGRIPLNAG